MNFEALLMVWSILSLPETGKSSVANTYAAEKIQLQLNLQLMHELRCNRTV
jgi:hypothetical protein